MVDYLIRSSFSLALAPLLLSHSAEFLHFFFLSFCPGENNEELVIIYLFSSLRESNSCSWSVWKGARHKSIEKRKETRSKTKANHWIDPIHRHQYRLREEWWSNYVNTRWRHRRAENYFIHGRKHQAGFISIPLSLSKCFIRRFLLISSTSKTRVVTSKS